VIEANESRLVERPDIAEHGLSAADQSQHLRRLVNGHDRMTERQEGMRQPPGAAPSSRISAPADTAA
jgi:hypothetical protein